MIKTRILNITEITTGVYTLKMPRHFDFKAGQMIALDLMENNSARLYSIASGEQDDFIEILFNIVPDGKLTPQLSNVKEGDTIYISEPRGSFIGQDVPAYWIATGTGIAPFASMFRSGMRKDKVMIHGGQKLMSFYYQELFESGLNDNYIRCCSQEESENVFHGRVTDYLSSLHELPQDHLYYLCGSSEMIVDVRDILIAKGISFKNILSEIYF